MHNRCSMISNRTALALCLVGAIAPGASAQEQPVEPSTKGFSIGGHVTVASSNPGRIDVGGERTDPGRVSGAGGGLIVSYGVTDWFAVYLNGDGREDEGDRHLGFADLGLRFSFRGHQRLRPHLDVALAGRRAEFAAGSESIDARGAGVSLGGGLLYFLNRSFALETTLLRTAGELDPFKRGTRARNLDAVGVSSTRLNIGIRWYPGK